MRVAFLTTEAEYSPWAEAIRGHAERLDHSVAIVLAGGASWPGFPTATRIEECDDGFDVALAFGWRACTELFQLEAKAYAYWVPALEDALMWAGDEKRFLATLTYDLPVHLIAETRAVEQALRERAPEASISLVPMGVDPAPFQRAAASNGGPLRLLVADAQPDFAAAVIAAASRPVEARFIRGLHNDESRFEGMTVVDAPLLADRARLYAEADAVLELARAEAPLRAAVEAQHAGVPAVVTPSLGHDEVVADGESAIVVDWDDVPGTANALDRLAAAPELQRRLGDGALARAGTWPRPGEATAALDKALKRALDEPPDRHWPRRLILNARAAVEGVARERHAIETSYRDIEKRWQMDKPAWFVGNALRPLWRPAQKLLHLWRRLKRTPKA